MAEQEIVVDKERVDYEGIFSVAELYRLIDEWFLDKGYYRFEPRHVESAKPEGKFVELDLQPTKQLTDYAKSVLKIRVQLSNIKDVTVEGAEGVKQRLNQGKVHLVFTGVLETDYEGKWEGKPLFMFIRTVYDKYIYKTLTGGFQQTVRDDILQLKNNIAGFLNLHRYTT